MTMEFSNTEEGFVLASLKEFIKVWGSGSHASLNLECMNGQAQIKLAFQLDHPASSHYRPHQAPFPRDQARNDHDHHQHLRRQKGPARRQKDLERAQAHRASVAAAEKSAPKTPAESAAKESPKVAVEDPENSPTAADAVISSQSQHKTTSAVAAETEEIVTTASTKCNPQLEVEAAPAPIQSTPTSALTPTSNFSSPASPFPGHKPVRAPPANQDSSPFYVRDTFCSDRSLNQEIPQLDGAMLPISQWACKCCRYCTYFNTEDDLERHHDTAHNFIEYQECNLCNSSLVWT